MQEPLLSRVAGGEHLVHLFWMHWSQLEGQELHLPSVSLWVLEHVRQVVLVQVLQFFGHCLHTFREESR